MEKCSLPPKILAVAAALTLAGVPVKAGATDHSPQLLLTPQRLRRLQRDRDRQTVRWINFDNRVQSAPDSPERGFELALYYAVTREEKPGREAIQWALAHPCDRRQVALILDWVDDLVLPDQTHQLAQATCPAARASRIEALRDELFFGISLGRNVEPSEDLKTDLLHPLENGDFQDSRQLYAAVEIIDAVRTTQRIDLREEDRQFFSALPTELLLSLKPDQIEHPAEMTHIAALALVSLDPNLSGSQYLQAWAIENRQMIRDGPGVGYELLWGDPYLPGVGYQNLEPWVYDPAGRLFARADWNPDSCWIRIAKSGVEEENCPPAWRVKPIVFSHLTLVPITATCIFAPHRPSNEVTILWNVQPHQSLSFLESKKIVLAEADPAGMWRLPANVEGNVCIAH